MSWELQVMSYEALGEYFFSQPVTRNLLLY
jgi:hypothetical protein